jgi:hypothetical protein
MPFRSLKKNLESAAQSKGKERAIRNIVTRECRQAQHRDLWKAQHVLQNVRKKTK